MDFATIVGSIGIVLILVLSILAGSELSAFANIPGLMIVVGGTVMVGLIINPLNVFIGAFSTAARTILTSVTDMTAANAQMLELANAARKEGLLALESQIESVEDPLMRKGLELLVDGIEPELIETILYDEVDAMTLRHQSGIRIFQNLAASAPSLGLVGTLIGLVQMLQTMDDPSAIGPAMAVALLTTFYGAILANVVFLPIAGKLQIRHDEEVSTRNGIITGLLGIANGVNPRVLEQQLLGRLPPKARNQSSDSEKDGE